MSENSVDVDKIHELFIDGEKLAVIAHKLGVGEGYIQQIISKDRKKNPEKWPKRQQKKSCDNCRHFGGALGRCMECIHSNYVRDYWEQRGGAKDA